MSTQYTTDNRSIYNKNCGSHVDDKGSYIPLTAMSEDQANGRCNGKHWKWWTVFWMVEEEEEEVQEKILKNK